MKDTRAKRWRSCSQFGHGAVFVSGGPVNKIEQIKAEKDGLDVGADIPRYARLGVDAIEEGDLERLKWWGVFLRRHTPGHFMMRIRIPNGISNAAQLRTIAAIANRSGRGIADITTRQQLQLRWIRFEDVPAILAELRAVGLVTLQTGMDNIRNVVGCAVAGITRNELFDASPVARAFTDVFVGDKAYTNLPRKFNVTITGCRESCVHAETQDIALVPATAELDGRAVAGFNVLIGGKNGSGGYRLATPLDVFVRPEEAAEVCSAIVLLFRDHGSRDARNKIRFAFLVEEWGETRVRDALEARIGRTLESKIHDGKPVRIHWSGCPAGCGNHTVADIGLLGVKAKVDGQTVDAVDVFVGGSSGPQPTQGVKILENVPCDTLPTVLEGLIRYGEPEKLRRRLRPIAATASAPPPGADPPRARTADARRQPVPLRDEP